MLMYPLHHGSQYPTNVMMYCVLPVSIPWYSHGKIFYEFFWDTKGKTNSCSHCCISSSRFSTMSASIHMHVHFTQRLYRRSNTALHMMHSFFKILLFQVNIMSTVLYIHLLALFPGLSRFYVHLVHTKHKHVEKFKFSSHLCFVCTKHT